MPLYNYECDRCGSLKQEFSSIHEYDPPDEPVCCGVPMARDYSSQRTVTGVFHKPVEMQSLGMAHQDEIDAFRDRNPDIEVNDNPDHPLFGVPIATTRQEKLGILQKEGYQEMK